MSNIHESPIPKHIAKFCSGLERAPGNMLLAKQHRENNMKVEGENLFETPGEYLFLVLLGDARANLQHL